jgi:hypothetical protein
MDAFSLEIWSARGREASMAVFAIPIVLWQIPDIECFSTHQRILSSGIVRPHPYLKDLTGVSLRICTSFDDRNGGMQAGLTLRQLLSIFPFRPECSGTHVSSSQCRVEGASPYRVVTLLIGSKTCFYDLAISKKEECVMRKSKWRRFIRCVKAGNR